MMNSKIRIIYLFNVDVYFKYNFCIIKNPIFPFYSPGKQPLMAYSKAPRFDTLSFNQSFWAKALAHPARIIILDHLQHHGTTAFYILAGKIPLAKTTVSQHLRMLRQSGLIESTEIYPHTYYKLNRIACRDLVKRINSFHIAFLKDKGDLSETSGHNLRQG